MSDLPHEYKLSCGPAVRDAFFGVVKAYKWPGKVEYLPHCPVLTIVKSEKQMPERLKNDLGRLIL